ncbi:MAG: radical SAM protein [Spirochaetes bacterium]|nr:radical SAM protein [Spirochaetota bacterium]
MKYLFGPVNSRRLGISLGVDLVPHKTCSLNCVYCECGDTTALVTDVAEWVPTREVIAELDEYLEGSPRLDVLTFSGSGEPTLHSGIGEIITHIRTRYPQYRIAVLTNGTMLVDPGVRRSIRDADIVVPSLDAVSPDLFERIARPAPGVRIDEVIEGLVDFRREFRGLLLLEIFVVPGVNDGDDELAALKDACLRIRPDRIQLNTLDRPGAVHWIRPATVGELDSIATRFAPLETEIIGGPAGDEAVPARRPADLEKTVLLTLRRRPSTIADLRATLGVDAKLIEGVLSSLREAGMVKVERLERGDFYRVV